MARLSCVGLLLQAAASAALTIGGSPAAPAKSGVSVGRVTAGPPELGLTVSALGFGTWSWGNRLLWDYDPSQDDEIYAAYRRVRDAGVTLFDTADSYGTFDLNGQAEKLLGEFERRYLEERSGGGGFEGDGASSDDGNSSAGSFLSNLFGGGRQSASSAAATPLPQQVATKFAPYPWRLTRSSMVNAARSSLERIGGPGDKLAIAQLHWSAAKYLPQQESALWNGLADVYDAGLCDAVGVSNFGPRTLAKFASRMDDRGVPFATAQVQYSLMTYEASKDMVDACSAASCRLISYSPLCLGLLTGKYDADNLPRPGNPRRNLFRELLPSATPLLRTLGAVADEYGKSNSQVAINWALRKGTVPIPGARTLRQAEENLGSVGWELRPDAVEELDRAASLVEKPMIQNIFQTD
mmetsp:Transcript_55492/g.166401  ORF Transcript_55492/g.166401 Transcript_55492/m.166401 type:complete len:410 (-) Transcript_55492:379-1608(-)|eukprot:CAMPEP_0113534506 /NCGR_PEP_ID=MMETSP0015_2-20120614/5194_1 /TAXON_ID=2838 /ORGANISM="Odontella" /LENGTH=409 /DNA_ID=CAMNT_0000433669 /DNA_START=83 /DNA_END=1312 /DNA_ORIENTATION=- /assembly_acc=CAM_ASM_000160